MPQKKLKYSRSHVSIAELEGGGWQLKAQRRLTLTERNDSPTAWTTDSRSVLFWSDSDGIPF